MADSLDNDTGNFMTVIYYVAGENSTTEPPVQQQGRVQATQMRVLRRIEGVNRMDRVRNEDIRQRLGQEDIVQVIRRRQENWKCKLDNMNSNRTTKKVFVGVMEGRRPRGRARMKWTDNF